MLFKYSQRIRQRWRAVVGVPDAGSGYWKSRRANGGQSDSRNDQVVRSRGPEFVTRRHVSNTDELPHTVVRRRSEMSGWQHSCDRWIPINATALHIAWSPGGDVGCKTGRSPSWLRYKAAPAGHLVEGPVTWLLQSSNFQASQCRHRTSP